MSNDMNLLLNLSAGWTEASSGVAYLAEVSRIKLRDQVIVGQLMVVRQECTNGAMWCLALQSTIRPTNPRRLMRETMMTLGEILGPHEAQQWLVRLRVIAERAKSRVECASDGSMAVLPFSDANIPVI
jgi:hypothetical protein